MLAETDRTSDLSPPEKILAYVAARAVRGMINEHARCVLSTRRTDVKAKMEATEQPRARRRSVLPSKRSSRRTTRKLEKQERESEAFNRMREGRCCWRVRWHKRDQMNRLGKKKKKGGSLESSFVFLLSSRCPLHLPLLFSST